MKPVLRFAMPLVSLLTCPPAHAYEVAAGRIMICDTQVQVERLAQLFDGNLQAAIGIVNTEEHDPTACAIADVVYVEGPKLGTARNGSHAFRIVPIVVVATGTPAGYQAVQPGLFFSLVRIEELAV